MTTSKRPCTGCGTPTIAMGGVCTRCRRLPCLDCHRPTTALVQVCQPCLHRRRADREHPVYVDGFEHHRDFAEVAVNINDLRWSHPDLWFDHAHGERCVDFKWPGGVPYSYAEHGLISREEAEWLNVVYRDRLYELGLNQAEAVRRIHAARGYAIPPASTPPTEVAVNDAGEFRLRGLDRDGRPAEVFGYFPDFLGDDDPRLRAALAELRRGVAPTPEQQARTGAEYEALRLIRSERRA